MKFSIVMPTFNHERFIFEAIDSIRSQTYTNWELIVVNDGSTDNTKEILNEYAKIDPRIKTYHKANGGTVSALNFALKKISGDWIFWLSSDDFFESVKLESHFNYILKNKGVDFIHTNHFLFDNEKLIKYESNFNAENFLAHPCNQTIKLLELNYINGVTISMSKSALDEIGYFDHKFRAGHDYDYWLRLSLKFKIHYINSKLSTTRIHPGQDTAKSIYRGIIDSGLSAFECLRKFSHIIFPTEFKDENEKIQFLNSALNVILNQNSYINTCGLLKPFTAYTSSWIKNSFSSINLANIIIQLNKNEQFHELINFLNHDFDVEYISNHINPTELLYEKYLDCKNKEPELATELLKYIKDKCKSDYSCILVN